MRKSAPDALTGRPGSGRPALNLLLAFLAVAVSYLLFSVVNKPQTSSIHVFMYLGILACGMMALRAGPSAEKLIPLIIAAGIVMRIGYMLYTPYYVRAHDVATLKDAGHFSYLYNLFKYGMLPQTNDYQYYHPPLQHIAQAAVVRLFSFLQPEADTGKLMDAAKVVPCFASCAVLIVSSRICQAVNMPKAAAAAALAVVAFHPTFFILSASINNDSLMLLFFMASILFTIRWYYRPTMANVVLVAASIGLSMMTKLSGGVALVFSGAVFLIKLVESVRKKERFHPVRKLSVFAAVLLPLAFWYPIRNYILFRQPLNFVLRFEESSPFFLGDRPFIERFLFFPAERLYLPTYCMPAEDSNIWLYVVKCSVFGEFKFEQLPELAHLLTTANLVLILLSLASMVYVMIRGRDVNPFARFGLFGIWLAQMASFLLFNVQFPFGCTMDFRYIVPTAITGAIYLGIALDMLKRSGKPVPRLLFGAGVAAIALFAAASVLFYVT